MKRNSSSAATAAAPATESKNAGRQNGHTVAVAESPSVDLTVILASLQKMQEGDFSVRLPGSWIGLPGKIADTFNNIVMANEHMARELKRVGQAVGKEGKTRERTRFHQLKGAWGEMEGSVNVFREALQ
jgi:hypothetical protein